jgi:hypothetical protein
MKFLSISNVSLVGALILGVLAAWSAAGPQRISGNQLVAGCLSPCEWHAVTCDNKPEKICRTSPDYCRYKATGGECYNAGGSTTTYQCVNNVNCVRRVDKICVEIP